MIGTSLLTARHNHRDRNIFAIKSSDSLHPSTSSSSSSSSIPSCTTAASTQQPPPQMVYIRCSCCCRWTAARMRMLTQSLSRSEIKYKVCLVSQETDGESSFSTNVILPNYILLCTESNVSIMQRYNSIIHSRPSAGLAVEWKELSNNP